MFYTITLTLPDQEPITVSGYSGKEVAKAVSIELIKNNQEELTYSDIKRLKNEKVLSKRLQEVSKLLNIQTKHVRTCNVPEGFDTHIKTVQKKFSYVSKKEKPTETVVEVKEEPKLKSLLDKQKELEHKVPVTSQLIPTHAQKELNISNPRNLPVLDIEAIPMKTELKPNDGAMGINALKKAHKLAEARAQKIKPKL